MLIIIILAVTSPAIILKIFVLTDGKKECQMLLVSISLQYKLEFAYPPT